MGRRSVLLSGAAAPLVLSAPLGRSPRAAAETPEDFAALNDRWRSLLTGGETMVDDPRLDAARERQDEDAAEHLTGLTSADPLWPDLEFTGDASVVSEALTRLRAIALAWATPGCEIHRDEEIGERLAAALQVIAEDGYHPGLSDTGNWWFWEIGIPNHLTDVLSLAYDAVPAQLRHTLMDAIEHFAPDPGFRGRGTSLTETGANRVDKSLRCALRGILRESAEDLILARDTLSDVAGEGAASVFGYVTSGDGFYEDGSFIQHDRLPYVGTYGTVALDGISRVLALLAGSDFEVTDPDVDMILESVETTFAPFIWQGVMMDTVRGRAVSRQDDTGAKNTLSVANAALLLAEIAAEDRDHLLGRALGWIEVMPLDITEVAGVAQIARWIQAESEGVEPIADERGLSLFADQERFTHRGDGWAFTVSTSSERIGRYEWGNKENATGWYQGDGATYLQIASDPEQTGRSYWPTVDPYRLPGTTVEMSERTPGLEDGTGIPEATATWAGGTSVRGSFGAWGMEHLNHDDSLRGKLSWFLLDDAVVALGAGITSTGDAMVETTVENRAGHDGAPTLRMDGEGDTSTPRWVHLEGVGGYVFLDGATVRATEEQRHGAWSDINQGSDTSGDDDVHTVSYATLSLLHGVAPQDARYAYALLPGRDLADTRSLAPRFGSDRTLDIIANTPRIQALTAIRRAGRLLLANAFSAAEVEGLMVDGPASVAVLETASRLHLAVSDPSRTAESITVTLPGTSGRRVAAADESIEIVSLDPLTLTVAVGGSRGHAHRCELRV